MDLWLLVCLHKCFSFCCSCNMSICYTVCFQIRFCVFPVSIWFGDKYVWLVLVWFSVFSIEQYTSITIQSILCKTSYQVCWGAHASGAPWIRQCSQTHRQYENITFPHTLAVMMENSAHFTCRNITISKINPLIFSCVWAKQSIPSFSVVCGQNKAKQGRPVCTLQIGSMTSRRKPFGRK